MDTMRPATVMNAIIPGDNPPSDPEEELFVLLVAGVLLGVLDGDDVTVDVLVRRNSTG